jgi:hypothetical protein
MSMRNSHCEPRLGGIAGFPSQQVRAMTHRNPNPYNLEVFRQEVEMKSRPPLTAAEGANQ